MFVIFKEFQLTPVSCCYSVSCQKSESIRAPRLNTSCCLLSMESCFGKRDYISGQIIATENTTWAPKWWFSKGNPLISGKSRLVKYYNLTRYIMAWFFVYTNPRKFNIEPRNGSFHKGSPFPVGHFQAPQPYTMGWVVLVLPGTQMTVLVWKGFVFWRGWLSKIEVIGNPVCYFLSTVVQQLPGFNLNSQGFWSRTLNPTDQKMSCREPVTGLNFIAATKTQNNSN